MFSDFQLLLCQCGGFFAVGANAYIKDARTRPADIRALIRLRLILRDAVDGRCSVRRARRYGRPEIAAGPLQQSVAAVWVLPERARCTEQSFPLRCRSRLRSQARGFPDQ